MNQIIPIAAAVLVGACLSVQPAINAYVAKSVGSPYLASAVSIGVSLILVLLLWRTLGGGKGNLAAVLALPWWVLIGGAVGVMFVTGAVLLAPALGVTLFFICVVLGQFAGGLIVDQIGAFGVAVRPVSTMKLVGLLLVIIGAIIVQRS